MNDSPSTDPVEFVAPRPNGELAAVFILDANGLITTASAAAHTLWESAGEGLLGTPFASLFVFEVVSDEPGWLAAQWEVLLGATLDQATELQIHTRSGSTRNVRVRIEPLATPSYLATVQPVATGPATDATSEGIFSLLSQHAGAGFFELDFTTGRVNYSPGWKKILGYYGDELPDTLDTWRELIHPDDSAAAPDRLGRKLTVGVRAINLEFRMRHRLGHWVWIQCIGVQVIAANGTLERVAGMHLDITERKELEEASVAADERLEQLGTVGPLGLFDLDFAHQRFWFSPGWFKLLGYRDAELPEELSTFAAAVPPEDMPGGIETWLQLRAPGLSAFVEPEQLVGKDGRRITVLLGAQRTLTKRRELARVTGFICLPPRLPVPEEETESLPTSLIRDALDALSEGLLLTDALGKILHLNTTAARLLAVTSDTARGQPVADYFRLLNRESGRPGDDPCERALTADQPLPLIAEHSLAPVQADAEVKPIVWTARASFDATGKPLGVAIVFRDPDEMNLTPEELVKANRLESLGLLASGVAHDFNNLLTTILAGVSLAKDNRDTSALGDSEHACIAAKGLTRQLLAFAKGGVGTQTVVAPGDIVNDSLKLAAAGSTAEVALEIAGNVHPVRVDRAQILQVFQNLVVNALQAMPPPPHRPRLHIHVSNTSLADEQIPLLAAGDYVEFQVRDNASGIAPENLPKIFDPFFTTKKHGTGLGLATVLSIVRKHGGQIGVDSSVGVGTVFTVYLPRADAPIEVQARKAPTLRFGTGRVLFMDDDPKISSLTATMLQSLDYKYDLARNGEEAIALYQRYLNIGRPYDAVLLDITVVGGMGGEECFRALRALDPDVRAIVSSGYDNDDMARRFLEMGFCGYLTKPYRVAELGKVLKTVLG